MVSNVSESRKRREEEVMALSREKRRMFGTKEERRLCFQAAVASCPQSNAQFGS